jgi:hypothetical protein
MSWGDRAVVAALIVLWTVIAGRAERLGITTPSVFTLGGLALGGEHALQTRLRCFRCRKLPQLPKVLFDGAAFSTSLVVALERRRWCMTHHVEDIIVSLTIAGSRKNGRKKSPDARVVIGEGLDRSQGSGTRSPLRTDIASVAG